MQYEYIARMMLCQPKHRSSFSSRFELGWALARTMEVWSGEIVPHNLCQFGNIGVHETRSRTLDLDVATEKVPPSPGGGNWRGRALIHQLRSAVFGRIRLMRLFKTWGKEMII